MRIKQKKFTGVPDSSSDEFGDYLVLMGAVMREEMMIEWLKRCIVAKPFIALLSSIPQKPHGV